MATPQNQGSPSDPIQDPPQPLPTATHPEPSDNIDLSPDQTTDQSEKIVETNPDEVNIAQDLDTDETQIEPDAEVETQPHKTPPEGILSQTELEETPELEEHSEEEPSSSNKGLFLLLGLTIALLVLIGVLLFVLLG